MSVQPVHWVASQLEVEVRVMRAEQKNLLKELDVGDYCEAGRERITAIIMQFEFSCFIKLKLADKLLGRNMCRVKEDITSLQRSRIQQEAFAQLIWDDFNAPGPAASGC